MRLPRSIVLGSVATAAALVISLLLVEAGLQAASRVTGGSVRLLAPPWKVDAPVVADERLIYRGNPLRFDHDAAGYRNDRRPTRADVVTLGDSMTYGPADGRQAWPRVLADISHRSVYSMALPGYGPAQSLFQLDSALELQPEVVIVAPYFGNDLFDSFVMTRRHPALVSGLPEDLVRHASELDRLRMLEQEMASLFNLGIDTTPPPVTGARRWMAEHVKLFGVARALKHRLAAPEPLDPLLSRQFAVAVAALTPARREFLSPVEAAGWRTILGGRYRLRALDDNDPRIRVGFLVMCSALEQMAERARAAGKRFLVVLFPTKERVFWPLVSDPDRHPGLREMVAHEDRLRVELVARLEQQRVEVLDLLPVFRGASEQPYYEDADGHPNAAGHRAVAGVVAARLGTR